MPFNLPNGSLIELHSVLYGHWSSMSGADECRTSLNSPELHAGFPAEIQAVAVSDNVMFVAAYGQPQSGEIGEAGVVGWLNTV